MGNNQGIAPHETPLGMRQLTQQADRLSRQIKLNQFSRSIVRRIFVQRRQNHLIQIIKGMKQMNKIDKFLDEVDSANIQILDSFYEHIGRNSLDIATESEHNRNKKVVWNPFDRQIGICGSADLMSQKNWQPISKKYLQLQNLAKGVNNILNYQKYKDKGLQAIRKKEVCFIILAGGKNLRFGINEHKQCDILKQLPSKPSLIEIMLKRLQALGRLIDSPIRVFVMVDSQERKNKIRAIKSMKIPNPEYIEVDFLNQITYGCLDIEGKVVVTDDSRIFFHPNGNGDIWGHFQGKNYQSTGLNNYKYFQIFGVSNILEHCFDCYMVGKLISQNLPWVTMASQNPLTKDIDPVIFINHDKTVHVRDPQEIGNGMDFNNLSYFPSKCQQIFLNNTVFSGQFIELAVKNERWLEYRKYHCKRKNIHHRSPLSKYSTIFTFQRELTDIFAITGLIKGFANPVNSAKNLNVFQLYQSNNEVYEDRSNSQRLRGSVVLVNNQFYNSPYYTKIDKIIGVVSLSEMYKSWLNINKDKHINTNKSQKWSNSIFGKEGKLTDQKDEEYYQQKLKEICEIDPFVSLEGENLQEIVQQISKQGTIDYPFYVGSEHSEGLIHIKNSVSTHKEQFEKLGEYFVEQWKD